MSTDDGTEPVADDEILYRRIPVSCGWYSSESGLSPVAFEPRKDETTGISVFRAKYKSIDQAATGRSKKGYYVAVLCAGDLRRRDIEVVPNPLPDEPGHAELPDLTCENRRTSETLERTHRLVEACRSVEGPFLPPTE